MNTILLTIVLAFIIVVLAVGLLAIGWLITGKSKIKLGACGRDPNKKRDEDCSSNNSSCGICERKIDKDK
jgi:hypothetical protein